MIRCRLDGRAAQLAAERRADWADHTRPLRDRLEARLTGPPLEAEVLSCRTERLANTSCFVLPGVPAETLLMNLDLEGIGASSGSACATGSLEASPTLLAMGLTSERAGSSLRVSLGRETKEADVTAFARCLEGIVERLREGRSAAG